MDNPQETSRKTRALYEMQNFNNMLRTVLAWDLSPAELNKIYDHTDVCVPRRSGARIGGILCGERGNRISVAYLDKVAEGWSEKASPEKAEDRRLSGIGRANRLMSATDGPAVLY